MGREGRARDVGKTEYGSQRRVRDVGKTEDGREEDKRCLQITSYMMIKEASPLMHTVFCPF